MAAFRINHRRHSARGVLLALTTGLIALCIAPASAQSAEGPEAAARLATACTAGDADACYKRGEMSYYDFYKIPQNKDEALRYFMLGCDAGSAQACSSAGKMWLNGNAGRDFGKARRLWTRACALDPKASCASLATMLQDGLGGPVDYAGAQQAYDRACKAAAIGCDGAAQIAAAKAASAQKARAVQAAAAATQRSTGSASRVSAGNDSRCTDGYNRIIALFGKGMSDAQISWALEYETAKSEGRPCPPNFPGAPALQTVQPQPQRPAFESWYEPCLGTGRRYYQRQGDEVTYGPCKKKEDWDD